MGHYGLQPGFWKEFLIIMAVVVFLVAVIPAFLRRWMGADKRKWFSYNYINEFHKKGDWTLRVIFIFSVIACGVIFIARPLILILISAFFTVIQLGFQTYVEWRFSENRSNYKLTLIEISLITVTVVGVVLWLE
ncbi:hypothetical protein GCM10011409_24460 [Lentibacillus populi]|uniref:DUF4181 domain-containing protein n=1 Tax=Lentibacillus populi TaxID=1827502 RepID=A0A9W5TY44_9BACI|nr:DUF4181 domain-containing protein [Lentibacillus populi]MBT2218596.1 DUF4181 domain-containing protein [Virgibacillus dakarensis]GGB46014.1 hypothetical protein GCM10011409_24460 [Lentibacillus populi]